MNIFVLCTGRSGSTGFIKACKHITNYTASHESKSQLFGEKRFAFSENHIEADNRLSWQLGELEKKFGEKAFYVHLIREPREVAQSFMHRYLLPKSMIYAYANGIKKQPPERLNPAQRFEMCMDYVETVNSNIDAFLKDKPLKITIELKHIKPDFKTFWNAIEAEGNLELALKEFDTKHNKRPSKSYDLNYSLKNLWLKLKMILRG